MSKWARIDENDTVIETIDFDPSGKFHPSITWVEVPGEVEQGWTADGDMWSAPEVVEGEPVEQTQERVPFYVSVIEFKMSFTSAERQSFYALKDAGDAVITDWLMILDDPRCTKVDLNLSSTQEAVNYMIGKVDGFDEARAASVLAGEVL